MSPGLDHLAEACCQESPLQFLFLPPPHDGFLTCRDGFHSVESVDDTLAREQEIPKAFGRRFLELCCLDELSPPLDKIFASLSLALPG